MKYLKLIVIALLISPALIVQTGCSDDPVVTPVDTTDNTGPEINNRFTIGFDQYDLVIDENTTYGALRAADSLLTINVVGTSTKVSGTPIVDGRGEVEIVFTYHGVGEYSQNAMDDVEIELATGEGNKRKEFSFDANSNMKVNITQMDSVGGVIKGTFSGILKSGINTHEVKKGEFQVERAANQ